MKLLKQDDQLAVTRTVKEGEVRTGPGGSHALHLLWNQEQGTDGVRPGAWTGDHMDWTICSSPGWPNPLPTFWLKVLTQICPEQEVKTKVIVFPWHSIAGFISEAANLVLLRVMGWRRTVPSNARFLALDTEGKLCYSTYVRGLPGRGTWPGAMRRGTEDTEAGEKTAVAWKTRWGQG